MTALVLVAAGSGQRLGEPLPKALVQVAGHTMVGHCLRTAEQVADITEIVVVGPADHMAELATGAVTAVPGGSTRDESVRAGLAALSGEHEHVLVHDAARPFAPAVVYERVLQALASGARAVVPALPVVDTIKRVARVVVSESLDRTELVAVQTPQGFAREVLLAAHDSGDAEVTDDAMRVEALGETVVVVAGAPESFKITTAFDLAVAQAWAAGQEQT